VTFENERRAAIEKLEDALSADDEDATRFHVREAIQLLQIADETGSADRDGANETAK